MGDPDAVELRPRVRVRVEVDDRVAVGAEALREHAQRGQRERVVAAEDERHRAGGEDVAEDAGELLVRAVQVAGRGLGVAVVDDVEHGERVDARAQVRAAVAALVVPRADGARAEAGARAVRGAVVERRADHGDVDALELAGVEDQGLPAERRAQAGVHGRFAAAQPRRREMALLHARGPYRRASQAPVRHSSPPGIASSGGVSARISQPRRIAIGGTR